MKLITRFSLFAVAMSLFFTANDMSAVAEDKQMFPDVWGRDNLEFVKEHISDGTFAWMDAYESLRAFCEKELASAPYTVMDKDLVPPSGDRHDYVSMGRYWWPDPEKPDGLPYVRRDGQSNPELEKLDRVRLGKMSGAVTRLALMYYLSGEEKYAVKAAELLDVWFLDEETRMNPSLTYGQYVPGHNGNKGRSEGIIDTYGFVEMLSGLYYLSASPAVTDEMLDGLRQWFSEYLDWMLTSKSGKGEHGAKNNHGVAYDIQVVAYAIFTGNTGVAEKFIADFPEKRIHAQIMPDGSQPRELARTTGFKYSVFNIGHFLDMCTLCGKDAADLFNDATDGDNSIAGAVRYMRQWLGRPQSEFPYQQITSWEDAQNALTWVLLRAAPLAGCPEYIRDFRQWCTSPASDLQRIIYGRNLTDVVAEGFGFAEGQLKVAVEASDSAAMASRLSGEGRPAVSPRTIEDGKLVMVPSRDWTSGFFPGELWYMYEYTGDSYWKTEAERFTANIEDQKTNAGTHDMGFKMYCSYGNGYRLTGDARYRDILLESAATLATRFNPNVGCIRSWDHGRDKWRYPVIIDNMMNLELLFWAFRETGDSTYYNIAVSHALTTIRNHFREDGSSWHVVDYDPDTGEVLKKQTHQGYNDDSAWARGQAWGLYGYTMCYRETGMKEFLEQAEKIASFMFSRSVPADGVFYWDYDDPKIPDVPRDASAAAVAASALYELSTYCPQLASDYRSRADRIVCSLNADYRAKAGGDYGFVLMHSTGAWNFEIDAPLVYADYYFLEALLRKRDIERASASAGLACSKQTLSEGWQFLREDVGSIWELVRPVPKGKPEEQPIWSEVTLPHTFNAEDAVDPDVNYYQGPGWYRTLIDVEPSWLDGRVLLEFEGAGQKTDVYVYMTKAGSHVGGYDKWYVDITDEVRDFLGSGESARFGGRIPLSIRCDNSKDAEMIPSSMSDFIIYGGLYRNVNLVSLPAVSAFSLKVDSVPDGDMAGGSSSISVEFLNPSGFWNADVDIVIKSPDGKTVVEDRKQDVRPYGTVHLGTYRIDDVSLWSPSEPSLYTVEVSVSTPAGTSSVSSRTGFRTILFEEKGPFILNGERLLLRGTHRHEDHAGTGAAMTPDVIRKEMQMIKDMGANFIRLGHYQQSDLVLDLCDSLGIMVWEEIPWCRGGLGGDAYKAQARRMLRNMIGQHYNHPSVILWGLGNENDWPGDFPSFSEDAIRDFMSELDSIAHSLDPSRYTSIRRCAFCSDIPDVYSPSVWAGWYSGAYRDYVSKTKAEFRKTDRMFHAEWGGDSHAGRNAEYIPDDLKTADKNGDWSETYIVKLFDWHLKEQEKMPWLTGAAFWTFKDFATPLRPLNPVPYVNQKGVVQRDLTPKESYYVFQSYWTDRPMMHIYGHDWPVRWGAEGEEKEVLVYSNCPEVELFLNGESLGVKRRKSQDFPAAGLHWDVVFQPGENTLRAVSADGAVEDEITLEYQTEKWGEPASVEIETVLEEDGQAVVHVQVVDSNGIPCLDEAGFFEFGIAGDGELVQNQGTVTGSRKVQARNGRGEIRIRTNGGFSCVSASYEGVKTTFDAIFPAEAGRN